MMNTSFIRFARCGIAIITAVAILMSCVGLFPAESVFAEVKDVAATAEDFIYSVRDDGTISIDGLALRCATDISIPSEIDGKKVTVIANHAFDGYERIKSVTIPGSVTRIGSFCFYGCTGLEKVIIPEGVTQIALLAFFECTSLKSIKLPKSLLKIGETAFFGCNSLSSVTIPAGVTEIGTNAFRSCSSLKTIKVAKANKCFDSRNKCNAVIDSKTNVLVAGCKKSTIPDGVTGIADGAFFGHKGLKAIEIPESVTSIGAEAFRDCSALKSLKIPAGVTVIGENFIRGCSKLKKLTVEKGNKFYDSRNKCNAIIDSRTDVLMFACGGTKIPSTVKSIDAEAFHDCVALKSIKIPGSIHYIVASQFEGCTNLETVEIAEGVEEMGYRAFWDCPSLKSVSIPASMKYIVGLAAEAFHGSTGLEAITVANGNKVFDSRNDCNALIYTDVQYYEMSHTTEIHTNLVLGCMNTVIPYGVEYIDSDAFCGCVGLTSISIPDSVICIRMYAFADCTGLESITIPDSVTFIHDRAFDNCTGLKSINVKKGSYADEYFTSLGYEVVYY